MNIIKLCKGKLTAKCSQKFVSDLAEQMGLTCHTFLKSVSVQTNNGFRFKIKEKNYLNFSLANSCKRHQLRMSSHKSTPVLFFSLLIKSYIYKYFVTYFMIQIKCLHFFFFTKSHK